MVEILYATEEHHSKILEIADEMLGRNYLTEEHLKDDCHGKFMVAVEDGEIMGFTSCAVSKGKGYINDVAVLKSAQGKGIGTMLVYGCLSHLWMLGVRVVETHAWEYINDMSVPLAGPLERLGFERGEYCKEFYYRPETDYECTVCGTPCHCSAFLYTVTLDELMPPSVPQ